MNKCVIVVCAVVALNVSNALQLNGQGSSYLNFNPYTASAPAKSTKKVKVQDKASDLKNNSSGAIHD